MRPGALLGVVLTLVLGLTGCGLTMRDVPVPGTGVSGETIEVSADFAEVLNLAEGAPVKVDGVDAGKVAEISVDDFTAHVTMTVQTDAELRDGATARLRYTTPMGEVFVDVTNPDRGATLDDGDRLGLTATTTAPTVEDALAQASLLVNGGGLDQLQTITEELSSALDGNEGDYRTLLQRTETFLTEANRTSGSIDAVLTSLNSVSKTLSARERTINRAVRKIRPAARVLRRQTPQFTELLAEVRKFSAAANSTVGATRSQLLTMLKQVQPVLAEFAENQPVWEESLAALVTGAEAADEAVAGDYLNISLQLHLDGIDASGLIPGLDDLLDLIGLGGLLGGSRTAPEGASPPEPDRAERDGPGLGSLLDPQQGGE
ncbi:MCE family protein [Nocardioides sp. BGMRC 2183]|nr:MCE family protein [Nocardioides sp. BGMRC 2183]